MNINEILDQIEHGLKGVTPGHLTFVRRGNRSAGDLYETLEDDPPIATTTDHARDSDGPHFALCSGPNIRAIIDAYRAMENRAEQAERELEQVRTFKIKLQDERIPALVARAEAAEAKVARLTEALEFYAANDLANPSDGAWGANSTDFGYRARAALKAMENTDE